MSPPGKLRIRLVATVVAATATALLGAGCGNGEQNDYVDQINALQNQLVDQVTEVVSGDPPTNPRQAANVAGDLSQVFADGADEIEAVDPPEEVADLHQQLVDAIRNISDQIDTAQQAFTSGNAEEASQAAIELQNATGSAQTQLNSLIDQINAEFSN